MVSFYRRRGKRMLDVAGAAVGLVLTSPLLVATAVAVRRQLGPPVLFRQPRPGLGGRPFTTLKFRTMRAAWPGEDVLVSDLDRLTSFGRILRSTSIDELPEFWNVLVGDMSLVGPRPLLMEYLPRYTPEQARRHEVRPGITGWAQVNGRNDLSWDEKFALDVWYVDHVSLALDLRIVLRTLLAVMTRQGISASGHATAPLFRGGADADSGVT